MDKFSREDLTLLYIMLKQGLDNHPPFYHDTCFMVKCNSEDDFQDKIELVYNKMISIMFHRMDDLDDR